MKKTLSLHMLSSVSLLCLASLLLSVSHSASAKNWYVSGSGDDANDGASLAHAFRHPQKAADAVQAGDVVLIGNGVYDSTDTGDDSAILKITKSGTPDAWITWKALPGHTPAIHPSGWSGILISGSYQIIDGLSVIGANDTIFLYEAQEDARNKTPSSRFNTNGIYVNGRIKDANNKPHHIIIRNCTVSKNPGGGITVIEADYVTIEDNKVSENAWFMRYAGSGITYLNNWRFDESPSYHNIVQRNLVFNNKSLVPWNVTGKLSDGNGILMDVTDLEKQGATNANDDIALAINATTNADGTPKPVRATRPEWKGRTLIANNISAYNGGSGIGAFRTKRVDIVNNTTYWNGQIVGYAELHSQDSEDVVMLNNIAVPRPNGWITRNLRNTNRRFDYNIYPKRASEFSGPHDIVSDITFINPQPDMLKADFRLAKGSLAKDSGTDELPQTTDIAGKKRANGKRDRGAYEQ